VGGWDPEDYFDDYDLWKRMSATCDFRYVNRALVISHVGDCPPFFRRLFDQGAGRSSGTAGGWKTRGSSAGGALPDQFGQSLGQRVVGDAELHSLPASGRRSRLPTGWPDARGRDGRTICTMDCRSPLPGAALQEGAEDPDAPRMRKTGGDGGHFQIPLGGWEAIAD
jgi:hypothetical protein